MLYQNICYIPCLIISSIGWVRFLFTRKCVCSNRSENLGSTFLFRLYSISQCLWLGHPSLRNFVHKIVPKLFGASSTYFIVKCTSFIINYCKKVSLDVTIIVVIFIENLGGTHWSENWWFAQKLEKMDKMLPITF